MKKAILAAATILLASTNTANAEEAWPRWYLGLAGGGTYQARSDVDGVAGTSRFEYDNGYTVSGTLGYRLHESESLAGMNGNIELEIGYREQELENSAGEVSAQIYAINYVEHFGTGAAAAPYLGVGIGAANIEVDGLPAKGDDTVAIYQLMGGIGYQPETMPRTRLKIGYKYLGTFEDPSFSTGEFEYDNHSVEVGAEFQF